MFAPFAPILLTVEIDNVRWLLISYIGSSPGDDSTGIFLAVVEGTTVANVIRVSKTLIFTASRT